MNDPRAIEAIVLRTNETETKKNGLTRTVTFLLPNDGEHAFTGLVGQRLHLVCVRVNDDETETEAAPPGGPAASDSRGSEPSAPPASKRSWDELSPSAQAAIRCNEPDFQRFAGARDAESAATFVRRECGVKSRSELNTDPLARAAWLGLEDAYWVFQRDPRAA
jgi:hypothetical protein